MPKPNLALLTIPSMAIITMLLPVAYATAPSTATGSFTFTSSTIAFEKCADGNTCFLLSAAGTATGTFTGSFTISNSPNVIHKDGTGEFRGDLICTCSVSGHSGTIVFHLHGKYANFNDPNAPVTAKMVIKSSAGTLPTLHGHGGFTSTTASPVLSYSLQIHFSNNDDD